MILDLSRMDLFKRVHSNNREQQVQTQLALDVRFFTGWDGEMPYEKTKLNDSALNELLDRLSWSSVIRVSVAPKT